MNTEDLLLRKPGAGKLHYQTCGAQAGIAGLSRICDMLSEDELRHADALRALQNGVRVELAQSPTLDGARRILRTLCLRQNALSNFHGDLGGYLSAMDFESKGVGICGQLAREAAHDWEREPLLKIAAQDEMHCTLIEQMRELLAGELGDGVPDER